ncbi:MAG: hypothetical protein LBH11_06675, partial [Propionibacteriaceae bacterium]|nr:hypothetical protein [Propionibacteriaceae bacterium]
SWLENLAPARDTQPIHNLVIVPDEWSLQEVEPLILTRFGPADRVYNCPTTTAEIWTYDSDLKPMVNR